MAYQYPYDEELRKTPLNPEMIRYRIKTEASHSLFIGICFSVPLMLLCTGLFSIFFAVFSWEDAWRVGVLPIILVVAFILIFSAGMFAGVCLLVHAIIGYRRAARGEVLIEIDKLTYIEHDRPRVVQTRYRRYTVYEDFLHFKSGREYCDPRQEYRHRNQDDEEFITVAYAAKRETILCIYRLADYNWQE